MGARREVSSLDEGDVVLTFPDNMSAASDEAWNPICNCFAKSKAARRR